MNPSGSRSSGRSRDLLEKEFERVQDWRMSEGGFPRQWPALVAREKKYIEQSRAKPEREKGEPKGKWRKVRRPHDPTVFQEMNST